MDKKKKEEQTTPQLIDFPNFNQDGTVNIVDIVQIVQLILNQ